MKLEHQREPSGSCKTNSQERKEENPSQPETVLAVLQRISQDADKLYREKNDLPRDLADAVSRATFETLKSHEVRELMDSMRKDGPVFKRLLKLAYNPDTIAGPFKSARANSDAHPITVPVRDPIWGTFEQFTTITAHPNKQTSSLEELRLTDYDTGNRFFETRRDDQAFPARFARRDAISAPVDRSKTNNTTACTSSGDSDVLKMIEDLTHKSLEGLKTARLLDQTERLSSTNMPPTRASFLGNQPDSIAGNMFETFGSSVPSTSTDLFGSMPPRPTGLYGSMPLNLTASHGNASGGLFGNGPSVTDPLLAGSSLLAAGRTSQNNLTPWTFGTRPSSPFGDGPPSAPGFGSSNTCQRHSGAFTCTCYFSEPSCMRDAQNNYNTYARPRVSPVPAWDFGNSGMLNKDGPCQRNYGAATCNCSILNSRCLNPRFR
ncbi:hypothetical protein D6D01_00269 [Aureobasidium pullulans]|uniref:Uncharacterized protein n=1 Tax=Aureobasidium pullulans TaxID=5580 RepID=A0A4S9M439_AURPU|nr:hypothetical protein D6D01_00269 [Aureobasidium pullulans]